MEEDARDRIVAAVGSAFEQLFDEFDRGSCSISQQLYEEIEEVLSGDDIRQEIDAAALSQEIAAEARDHGRRLADYVAEMCGVLQDFPDRWSLLDPVHHRRV